MTAHLGVRFEDPWPGPGWKIRDVITNSPADREDSRLSPGDIILEVDGRSVDPALNPTTVLNGRLARDIVLKVQSLQTEGIKEANASSAAAETPAETAETSSNESSNAESSTPSETTNSQTPADQPATRIVTIRPISFAQARRLLYDQWLEQCRRHVEQASQGRLGYLHIRGMDMRSFHDFQRELYRVGYGRDGLVIDVRDNGGGSTTDLLLTSLTQPRHAMTVPRGGGIGYPQDRMIFASWHKPVIVLCNQNSYSNAEIFSHAMKTLQRGKLVGVPTAGGVISTGSAPVNDLGYLRMPFRGWFLIDTGEDMELNGAVPDVVLWPHPLDAANGRDRQLDKAIELLLEDVQTLARQPAPRPRWATQRPSPMP